MTGLALWTKLQGPIVVGVLVCAFLLRLQALCLDPRRSFFGDVEMTEVDVLMLVRGQRLDNAFAFGSGGELRGPIRRASLSTR